MEPKQGLTSIFYYFKYFHALNIAKNMPILQKIFVLIRLGLYQDSTKKLLRNYSSIKFFYIETIKFFGK